MTKILEMYSDNSFMKLLFILLSLLISSCAPKIDPAPKVDMQKLRSYQSLFEKSIIFTKETKIKYGQGLFQALKSIGLSNPDSLKIINSLRDYVEFDKLKVGDILKASFNPGSELVQFDFSNNKAEVHRLKRENSSSEWRYDFIEKETTWRHRIVAGQLNGYPNLLAALKDKGLSSQVANEVSNVLICKVNFRLDARAQDSFKILLNERIFDGEIIDTKILYTSYKGPRAGESEAFYYEDDEKQSTYTAHYTENGEALIRSGLRYPVKRLHIRSGYGYRVHPITGRRVMHRGVDLRGRTGEPVRAAASGIVIESRYKKYAGNKVAIRHADNSISYYLHLNKRYVRKGQRVKSHQKIGSIGATGRVTGPHLHFGFKSSKGRWMNPMRKRMIATPKLKGKRLANLQKQVLKTKVLLRDVEEAQISQTNQSRLPAQNNI